MLPRTWSCGRENGSPHVKVRQRRRGHSGGRTLRRARSKSMDALSSTSFRTIDPSVMRQLFEKLEQMEPEQAKNVYAQLWNHPDLFERVSETGAGDGAGAQGGED